MSTLASDDDFEVVARNEVMVPNDAVEDGWTVTEHNSTTRRRMNDDVNEETVPRNVVVVELPPSMNLKSIVDTNDSEAVLGKKGDGDDENESLGMASRGGTTIASSVIHRFEQCRTTDGSVAKIRTDRENDINDDENNNDEAKPPPTTRDLKNSDRRSDDDKSSRKWTMVGKQPRPKQNSDDSSVSTWESGGGGGGGGYISNDDQRSTVSITGANSTISGFDIISLNGTSSQRACPICTLLNQNEDWFCAACGASLIPNPCPDTDAMLAQQLQAEEDKYAFATIQKKETKRKQLFVQQPLIVQSREFKKDIYRFMNEFHHRETTSSILQNDKVGYDVLPEVSMVILASRFIETMTKNLRQGKNADVLIRYCVTPKLDGLFHRTIQENAFPANSVFSLHFPLAVKHQYTPNGTGSLDVIPEENAIAYRVRGLRPVQKPFPTSTKRLSDHLGWIAAIVKGDDTADVWHDDDTCHTRVLNPSYTLPLICFDASLWNTPVTKYLFQGMIRVCNDFFDAMLMEQQQQQQVAEGDTLSETKKARIQPDTAAFDWEPSAATLMNQHDACDDDDDDDDDDGDVGVGQPNQKIEENVYEYVYSENESDDGEDH